MKRASLLLKTHQCERALKVMSKVRTNCVAKKISLTKRLKIFKAREETALLTTRP